METVTLNNGMQMPVLGFGTYQIESVNTKKAVKQAINAGYRLIDTAQYYGNEAGVGQAVKESGISRDQFFITTKTPLSGYAETKAGIDESLLEGKMDYYDMVLIHWPIPDYLDSYVALEDAVKEGKIRAIGVSNFNHQQLQKVLDEATVKPAVNQVETHLMWQQQKMHQFLTEHQMVHEAWSPLGQAAETIMGNKVLATLAQQYHKTPAQISLRFLIQEGVVVIPKATHLKYVKENIDLFDFALSNEERQLLRAQDQRKSLEGWPSAMAMERDY